MTFVSTKKLESFLSLLVIGLYSISLTANAQGVNYRQVDFYDNSNGLSQGTINAIVQDKFGYLWLGTQDGLNKFDGLNFTVYKHNREDSYSISDNYINDLIVGKSGDLWIGTRSSGLNRYNILTGTFENYRNSKNKHNGISDNWVTSLIQDDEGNIWVGTSTGGLNMFDPNSKKFEVFRASNENKNDLISDQIRDLHIDNNQILWIGTSRGLCSFNLRTKSFQDITAVSTEVLSLLSDANGNLWVGTNGDGLKVLNANNQLIKWLKHDPDDQYSLPDNRVITLLADQNSIWVGTDGGGLTTYNPTSDSFLPVKVSFPRVKSLYRDNAGDIWVGTRGALNKVNIQNNRFQKYEFDHQNKPIAPGGYIHALCVDKEDFIWSGSSVNGLKRINRATLETKTYLPDQGIGSISSKRISYLFIDSNETMWVGTYEGLSKYDALDDSFKIVGGLTSGRVNIIYEDSEGYLWVGTENGLNKMDRKTQKVTTYNNNEGKSNGLYSNNVAAIIEDKEGIFWIGYTSGGFDRADMKANHFTHYAYQRDNPNALSNDRVAHIYDDGEGNIWLATYGGGLDKFEKSTQTFTNYNTDDGLANGSLYCVIPDKLGNIWMSHNEGISKFNIEKEEFKNYFEGEEFNSRAYYKTPSGEIFLAGFYIVSFYSENIARNELIPQVHINEFSLLNELITPSNNSTFLPKVVEEIDTLILNYDQNFFSFGFVSLNYTNPENNRLKYQLSNFDTDWVDASNYPRAYYTNVPPGKYLFKVQGSNNDGVWNEKGDQILIIIQAPWWGTLFFKVTAIGLFLLALFIFYKIRTLEIKRQKEDLERLVNVRTSEVLAHQEEIFEQKESISAQNEELLALNEEKNELIQIVAHDLRSPLNQIKGLASIIKIINPDLNKETCDSIDLINDLVDRQREMIGRILDTNAIDAHKANIKLVALSLNEVVEEVVGTLKVVADNKGIEFVKENPEEMSVLADKNYLIQVIENILSNAIKFSPRNKKVLINVVTNAYKVQLRIKDQGPGIGKKEMKFLFERYTKLSAKPTNNEESSGLGLSIAKKYVEAMGGKLWCESTLGMGAEFIIEFNIKSEA